jgi:hypothetical protein
MKNAPDRPVVISMARGMDWWGRRDSSPRTPAISNPANRNTAYGSAARMSPAKTVVGLKTLSEFPDSPPRQITAAISTRGGQAVTASCTRAEGRTPR